MISSPGIGSGIDINSLISKLVSAEGDAKTAALVGQRSSAEAKVSAFGKLKNALASLQSSLSDLKTADAFVASKVTSTDTDVIAARLNGEAPASGNFSIEVQRLAESQRLITAGFASADAIVGEGRLTIKVGDKAFDVSIDSDNSTLTGIKNAINSAVGNTGVTASLLNVDDGSGGTETKLILTANNTGTEHQITVTVDDEDLADTDQTGLSAFHFDADDTSTPGQLTEINVAVDAVVVIDGQKVTRSSNTITDAIEGITLTLKEERQGEDITIDLTRDTTRIKKAVRTFVDSFNTLGKIVSELSSYDAEKEEGGVLLGDATLLNISLGIYRSLTDNVGSSAEAINNIVDIGITTQANGSLELDSDKLDDAVNNHLSSFISFFTSDKGIVKRLDNKLEVLLKGGGTLDAKVNGLNGTIKEVNDSLVNLERRLEVLEEQLMKKFSALDILIARLQTTSNFLENQLGKQDN